MRIVIALLWLTSAATAEPARGSGSGGDRPPTVQGPAHARGERERWQPYTPANHGGFSGIVIVPPDTPDARPYPLGMVIEPPDVGDSMANALVRPWTWSSRPVWQRLGDGLRALFEQLLTHEV